MDETKRRRAALYLRVSTDEQTRENQRPILVRMARARRLRLVHEFGETISGASQARPAFLAMMKAARKGLFEVLLFWSLDRFGRGGMLTTLQDLRALDGFGVRVVSAKEEWLDTAVPGIVGQVVRDVMVGIVAGFAEMERERGIERTHAGLARARAEGITLGRPRVIQGVTLARARALLAEGRSMRAVASELGVDRSTLTRALHVPTVRYLPIPEGPTP